MESNRIKYVYDRCVKEDNGQFAPKGGATIAYYLDDESELLFMALTRCRNNERFVKKDGRDEATKRLNELREYYKAGNKVNEDNHYYQVFTFDQVRDVLRDILQLRRTDINSDAKWLSPAVIDSLPLKAYSDVALEEFIRSCLA